jgi:hypothetical protein
MRLADAVCANSRAILADVIPVKRAAAQTQLHHHKRTAQLIQELADASRELELLKADIDAASKDALAPKLKRQR